MMSARRDNSYEAMSARSEVVVRILRNSLWPVKSDFRFSTVLSLSFVSTPFVV